MSEEKINKQDIENKESQEKSDTELSLELLSLEMENKYGDIDFEGYKTVYYTEYNEYQEDEDGDIIYETSYGDIVDEDEASNDDMEHWFDSNNNEHGLSTTVPVTWSDHMIYDYLNVHSHMSFSRYEYYIALDKIFEKGDSKGKSKSEIMEMAKATTKDLQGRKNSKAQELFEAGVKQSQETIEYRKDEFFKNIAHEMQEQYGTIDLGGYRRIYYREFSDHTSKVYRGCIEDAEEIDAYGGIKRWTDVQYKPYRQTELGLEKYVPTKWGNAKCEDWLNSGLSCSEFEYYTTIKKGFEEGKFKGKKMSEVKEMVASKFVFDPLAAKAKLLASIKRNDVDSSKTGDSKTGKVSEDQKFSARDRTDVAKKFMKDMRDRNR